MLLTTFVDGKRNNGTPGYRYFVDAFCYAGDKTGYDEKAYSSVVKTAVR